MVTAFGLCTRLCVQCVHAPPRACNVTRIALRTRPASPGRRRSYLDIRCSELSRQHMEQSHYDCAHTSTESARQRLGTVGRRTRRRQMQGTKQLTSSFSQHVPVRKCRRSYPEKVFDTTTNHFGLKYQGWQLRRETRKYRHTQRQRRQTTRTMCIWPRPNTLEGRQARLGRIRHVLCFACRTSCLCFAPMHDTLSIVVASSPLHHAGPAPSCSGLCPPTAMQLDC